MILEKIFNRSGLIPRGRLVCLSLSICLFSAGFAQPAGNYLTHQQLSQALRMLSDGSKGLAKLESFAKTAEGRDLWVLTLAKPGNIPVDQRPGLLIAANFEGDHLVGSSLALETARYLLGNYDQNDSVRKSLDNYVFYIMPRLNPDGAEAMFASLKAGTKTNSTPFDADNDGRLDEDGPDDLNNDGMITVFRVKDPNGLYCADPEEPMLMKKAEAAKGESGIYSLYMEGIDNDKDGFINEDPPGGTDLNRNFMHAYPYFKENAGKHMVSEAETRALLDWMLAHKNIGMVLTFGESDNLITAPNSRGQLSSDRPLDLVNFASASSAGASRVGMVATGGRGFDRFSFMMMGGDFPRGGQAATQQTTSGRQQRPAQTAATTVSTADLDYFTKIGDKYKELTGIKTQPPLRNPEGAFFQYAYYQFGVPAFCTPGWGITLPADTTRRGMRGGAARGGGNEAPSGMNFNFGGAQVRSMSAGSGRSGAQSAGTDASGQQEGAQAPGIDATYLKWLTTNNPAGFVNWQPAKHPEYGDIEVGGFAPYDINNPPFSQVADLGKNHGKFAVYLSTLFAQVKIIKTEVVNEGGGLFRIKAEIANEGFLPTAMRQGVQSRSVKPTMVQLEVKPEQILSGNSKTNFFQALDGSGRRMKYEWLIKAGPGEKTGIRVVSQKAGSDYSTITLK